MQYLKEIKTTWHYEIYYRNQETGQFIETRDLMF
jgi:hypothetical protein